MKNVMNGQSVAATTTTVPTLHVGTYRRTILAVICDNDLFTAEEQLRANHNVHECEDAARLALWLRNVRRVAAEREALAESGLVAEPTSAQLARRTLAPAVAVHLIPAASLRPLPTAPPARPVPGYTGRAADYHAEQSDHHLEQWYIRETGYSFADLARL